MRQLPIGEYSYFFPNNNKDTTQRGQKNSIRFAIAADTLFSRRRVGHGNVDPCNRGGPQRRPVATNTARFHEDRQFARIAASCAATGAGCGVAAELRSAPRFPWRRASSSRRGEGAESVGSVVVRAVRGACCSADRARRPDGHTTAGVRWTGSACW